MNTSTLAVGKLQNCNKYVLTHQVIRTLTDITWGCKGENAHPLFVLYETILWLVILKRSKKIEIFSKRLFWWRKDKK